MWDISYDTLPQNYEAKYTFLVVRVKWQLLPAGVDVKILGDQEMLYVDIKMSEIVWNVSVGQQKRKKKPGPTIWQDCEGDGKVSGRGVQGWGGPNAFLCSC